MNAVATRATNKIAAIYDRIEAEPQKPVWISVRPREEALADAEKATGPLAGVPFAVKDNIDVAGMRTTAGCPAFAYTAIQTATVVEHLQKAGAVLVGKTNMDQFATGLVGTRTPYGACSSIYDSRYISGGSSSGSAVAVAKELVTFALGTDTAGSGRVPAAFNNLIGVKPTRGLLSTAGVFPACRSLDCVSIFAQTMPDARAAFDAAMAFDEEDSYSRLPRPGANAAPWSAGPFRFGVPAPEQLEFFGDDGARALYEAALEKLTAAGGERVEIDFGAFRCAANLLYSGPWVAERYAAVGDFLRKNGVKMDATVRRIISSATEYSAADAYCAEYKLRDLRRATEREWRIMDVLALPTTGTIFTHDEVASDPIKTNTSLGYYTNFVNLLDLAAIAVPAGFRPNGLPAGLSLIGRAFSDQALLDIADRYLGSAPPTVSPGCVSVAVVGAHLTGQTLNGQLTNRRARMLKACRTAPGYRLYALDGTKPPKPGLVRDPAFQGPGIEVEVWAIPEDEFGGFVAEVPPPLGIGNATLESGESVKSFICEPCGIDGAREITEYGGWRAYLASLNS